MRFLLASLFAVAAFCQQPAPQAKPDAAAPPAKAEDQAKSLMHRRPLRPAGRRGIPAPSSDDGLRKYRVGYRWVSDVSGNSRRIAAWSTGSGPVDRPDFTIIDPATPLRPDARNRGRGPRQTRSPESCKDLTSPATTAISRTSTRCHRTPIRSRPPASPSAVSIRASAPQIDLQLSRRCLPALPGWRAQSSSGHGWRRGWRRAITTTPSCVSRTAP